MLTTSKFPTAVIATETTLGRGSTTWNNPTYIFLEDGRRAETNTNAVTTGYFKIYNGSAYIGDLMTFPAFDTSAYTWTSSVDATGLTGLTPTVVNGTNFGMGLYVYSSSNNTKSRDLRSYTYGFVIPDEATIIGVSSRVKAWMYSGRYTRIDVVELTVSYELGGAQSPSSNAYFGGGPAMFRSPTDLFNILKKPIWVQTSRPQNTTWV